MPYAPNVAPDSTGIANGITNAGNAIAQGFQEMKQNQLLASTATAKFEGALQSSPELLQVLTSEQAPSNLASAYKKLQTGGQVGLKDAALLSTFADSFQLEKQKRQQQQMQDLQFQQAQKAASDQAAANSRLDALEKFSQPGTGASMMAPAARQQMTDALADPVTQFALQARKYTGKLPDAQVLAEYAKSVAANHIKLDKYDPFSYETVDAQGNPIKVTKDKRTGEVIGAGPQPLNYMPAAEQIKLEGGKKAAEIKAQADQTFLTNVNNNATMAQGDLAKLNEMERLYSMGTDSGRGQEFLGQAAAFAHTLGIPMDEKKLGDKQYMQSLMAQGALAEARANAGQGSFSDTERQLLQNAVANYQNTPEGNKNIISALKAVKMFHIDLERKRQELVDEQQANPEKPIDVAEKLKRWQYNNPISKYQEKMTKQASVKLPSGWSVSP